LRGITLSFEFPDWSRHQPIGTMVVAIKSVLISDSRDGRVVDDGSRNHTRDTRRDRYRYESRETI